MKTEEFLTSGDDMFAIFQLKNNEETRDVRFTDYGWAVSKGMKPSVENYDMVWLDDLDRDPESGIEKFLEDIFVRFNIRRPDGFEGHSLSVSDVIAVKENGEITAYYVNCIGYVPVAGFFDTVKNGSLKMFEDADVAESSDTPAKIKVFIVDGIIDEILSSKDAKDTEVEIVVYDPETCDEKDLDAEYGEKGLTHHSDYYVNRLSCGDDREG